MNLLEAYLRRKALHLAAEINFNEWLVSLTRHNFEAPKLHIALNDFFGKLSTNQSLSVMHLI